MTNECVYKNDGEMLVGSKTLKCSYCAETAYVDLKNAPPGYVYEYKKPDYSKMYFIFQFKDGKTAKYRMDKDCHNLQQFLDRMNKFHELEKENKRLRKQLKESVEIVNKYWEDESDQDSREFLEKWGYGHDGQYCIRD